MKRNMKQKGRDLLSLALCAAMLLSMMAFPAAGQEMTEQNQEEASSTNLETITTEGAVNTGTATKTPITEGGLTESEITSTTETTSTFGTPLLNNAYYGTAITSDYKGLLSDPISDGCVYSFVNAGSGMYLTSTNDVATSGYTFNIYQIPDNTTSAQAFRLNATNDGYYQIKALELFQSETRHVAAYIETLIGDDGNYLNNGISNVTYLPYSANALQRYAFDWRFEKVDGRDDAYRIFLRDTNYVLTALDNCIGSQSNISTSGSSSIGNIVISPLNVMNERQIWHLESGGKRMHYGINLRETFTTTTNGIYAEICSGTVNTPHFSYPVTEYGYVSSYTSSTVVCTVDTYGTSIIAKDTGNTYIRGIEYDSSGIQKSYKNLLCYVFLPRGMYYLSTGNEAFILEHSDSPFSLYPYYLINYATHNGQEPTDADQLFELVYLGKGEYCIIPKSHPTFLWYNVGGILASIEANVNNDFSQINNYYKWNISCNDTGYMLYSESSSYTLTGSNSPSAGGMPSLSAYSSTNTNQRWVLKKANFLSGYELAYNPDMWSGTLPDMEGSPFQEPQWVGFNEREKLIVNYNGSYNYALNCITCINTYTVISSFIDDSSWVPYNRYDIDLLHPGTLGNVSESNQAVVINRDDAPHTTTFNEDNLLSAVQADAASKGFTIATIGQYEVCPKGTYKLALVYGSNAYCWFRQNPNGTWSYFEDGVGVRTTDDSGNLIYDPYYMCHDDEYTTFYGYFAISVPNIAPYIAFNYNPIDVGSNGGWL